ncbi:hypothetical protein E2C01_052910 [Portunus trituberculatus]|uniref:Uncharacterized protein n=1 Tax=Portunus trituberculatus TaxID=210409 RepID=A0A5B7GF15_PORTR|nr:hypothetical protein [Portunus trituberculatus]
MCCGSSGNTESAAEVPVVEQEGWGNVGLRRWSLAEHKSGPSHLISGRFPVGPRPDSAEGGGGVVITPTLAAARRKFGAFLDLAQALH